MSKFPKVATHIVSMRLVIFYLIIIILILGKTPAFSDFRDTLNLLVITIDTLRADHIGIYGYEKINTPHIDSLGRKGAIFSNAFCHVPLTLPSHCSLFTGNLPLYHGVRDNGYRLPVFSLTLAEIMKDKGYKTAAFVGAFPLDSRFGLNKGFDVYDDFYGSRNIVRDLSFIERKAEEVNKKVIDWITNNRNDRFFVWVHYFDPHAPYEPPSPFDQDYAGREYDGEIAYTDHVIGQLLNRLDQLRLQEKTLIILTSDHGEGLGEHKEKTHGIFIYDSTLRVPLIFHSPRLLPENTVVSDQVGLIDVLPTVLDLMGWDNIPDMQGKSLKSVMLEGMSLPDKTCYIESVAAMMDRNWAPLQGIRTRQWKYIDAPLPELYSLMSDPKEENNILNQKPEIARRLKEQLKGMIQISSSSLSSDVLKGRMDEDTRRKLMSLGYITGRSVGGDEERPDPKTMIELDNLFNEAIIASETGNLELADLMYKEVLQKQPNLIMAYEYASYNYYKMGKLDDALELLEKAAKLDHTNSPLLARLGLYYQEAGMSEKSIKTLERVVQQDNNYAEAYNYLGVSYFRTGQVEKAIQAFNRSISLDNNYAMAMNNLGNCYLAQKKYDSAIKEYKKTISIDDHLASAFNGLGVAYYRKGLVGEALDSWEKSIEIDLQQTDTLYNLGRVYLRMGQKQKALHFFELFIKAASPQKYGKDIEEIRQVIIRLKKELKETIRE
jgi:arylsulfatase A-like enzyme/Flp pilus assembly protein TadD